MNEQHITNPSDTATPGTRRTPLGRRAGLALGLSAGLIGGAAVGLTLGIPGMTSAASPDATAVPAIVAQADETTDDAATDVDRTERMTERIRESLDTLVDDGTIDAGQADAVAAHLAAQAPDRGGRGGPGGHGGPGEGRGRDGGLLGSGVVSELIGLERSEIAEQLRDGSTLAEIAEANGVSSQALIDALVAEATERIDAAVESGRLDADEAAEKLSDVADRIAERVEQSDAD